MFTGDAKINVRQSFRIQAVVLTLGFIEFQAVLSVAHHLIVAGDSS